MASLERATRRYLVAFCALIACSSVEAFLSAWRGSDAPVARSGLLTLSGLEILASLGFLVPKLRRAAGGALALIFLTAALLHGVHAREVPAALLIYLATTLYLLQATRPRPEACAP